MNCKRIEKLLTQDLGRADGAEINAHLCRCQACRKLHDELVAIHQLTQSLGTEVKTPSDFSARVFDKISTRESWREKAVFSLILVVLFSGGVFWTRGTGFEMDTNHPDLAVHAPELLLEDGSSVDVPTGFENDSWLAAPYVEVIVKPPTEPNYILRLPLRIEVHQTHLHHDFYLHHASH